MRSCVQLVVAAYTHQAGSPDLEELRHGWTPAPGSHFSTDYVEAILLDDSIIAIKIDI